MHFTSNDFGKQGEYIEKKTKQTIGDAIDLSIQIIFFGGGVEVHIMGWGTYGNV